MNKDQIITSFGTVLEMLQDRGIDTKGVTKQNLADVLSADPYKQIVEVVVGKIKVIWYTPQKIKTADVKEILEDDIKNNNIHDLYILIMNESPTTNNMKSLQNLDIKMEIHLVKRLLFNITQHSLVPKHEVIRDKADVDALVSQYNLKNKYQLPIILKSDPIARYYGLKPGDVVRITRVSESAGKYTAYRCCM